MTHNEDLLCVSEIKNDTMKSAQKLKKRLYSGINVVRIQD